MDSERKTIDGPSRNHWRAKAKPLVCKRKGGGEQLQKRSTVATKAVRGGCKSGARRMAGYGRTGKRPAAEGLQGGGEGVAGWRRRGSWVATEGHKKSGQAARPIRFRGLR